MRSFTRRATNCGAALTASRSRRQIRAVVEETTQRRTYTAAHCHPASSIRRCTEFGVRSIEHGTLIDAETADYVAAAGAFIVPTMAIIFALKEHGPRLGFPPASQFKVQSVYEHALQGMEHMRKAGVNIAFGTDLLGALYVEQCREFTLPRGVHAARDTAPSDLDFGGPSHEGG